VCNVEVYYTMRDNTVRVNMSLRPGVIEILDRTASEMNMSRSALVSLFAAFIDTLDKNKPFNEMVGSVFKGIVKKG
jgi:hypothetical protein